MRVKLSDAVGTALTLAAIAVVALLLWMLPSPYNDIVGGIILVVSIGWFFDHNGNGHLRAGYLDGRIKVGRLRRLVYERRIRANERRRGRFLAELQLAQVITDLVMPHGPAGPDITVLTPEERGYWIRRKAYYSELERIYRRVTGEAWHPARLHSEINGPTRAELQELQHPSSSLRQGRSVH